MTIFVAAPITPTTYLGLFDDAGSDTFTIGTLAQAEAQGTPVMWLIPKPAGYDLELAVRREPNRRWMAFRVRSSVPV